jgi:hypothetical protein
MFCLIKTSMKDKAKFCWFCDTKVYSFVSICSDCEKQRRKEFIIKEKTNNITPLYTSINVKNIK